jgi:hypothetical protein
VVSLCFGWRELFFRLLDQSVVDMRRHNSDQNPLSNATIPPQLRLTRANMTIMRK